MSAIPIIKGLGSVNKAVNITDNSTTHPICRGIYIGVADDYKFYINGEWITFYNTIDGSVLPFRATGASHSDGSAPGSGDIIFLYTS